MISSRNKPIFDEFSTIHILCTFLISFSIILAKEIIAYFFAISFFGEFWIFVDFLCRLLICAIIALTIKIDVFKKLIDIRSLHSYILCILLLILSLFFREFFHFYLYWLNYEIIPSGFPEVSTPWIQLFDIILVLPFVALSEELVYRFILLLLFLRYLPSAVAVPLGAIIFASVHIDQGVVDTFFAFVIGCLYGAIFIVTRNLGPVIIAHFLHNAWVFGGTYLGWNTWIFWHLFEDLHK